MGWQWRPDEEILVDLGYRPADNHPFPWRRRDSPQEFVRTGETWEYFYEPISFDRPLCKGTLQACLGKALAQLQAEVPKLYEAYVRASGLADPPVTLPEVASVGQNNGGDPETQIAALTKRLEKAKLAREKAEASEARMKEALIRFNSRQIEPEAFWQYRSKLWLDTESCQRHNLEKTVREQRRELEGINKSHKGSLENLEFAKFTVRIVAKRLREGTYHKETLASLLESAFDLSTEVTPVTGGPGAYSDD